MKHEQEQIVRYREAATELQRELKSGEYKKLQVERAFIKWWCNARFGEGNVFRLSDGSGDGGLDAIVDAGGITYVVQSKYEKVPKVSLVTRSDVSAFDKVISLLIDPLKETEFDDWLRTVRADLRTHYLAIRMGYLKNPAAFRFIFITSKRVGYTPDEPGEIEDIQKITALWELYSEGYTPPTDKIHLNLDDAWHTKVSGMRTYVGVGDVKDFRREMSQDRNERLFAQNVRTTLSSKVNDKIRETYEQEPGVFWLGNNGIYVVCKKVISSGNAHELTYPSIINGSQTLHAINQSKKTHSCKILVRILEMDARSDAPLLDTVIRRTNSQNPMQLTNLFAHDSVQLNVARFLDRFKLFYERREKEWQNEKKIILPDYKVVNIKEVSQWLGVTSAGLGIGSTRSSVADLFENDDNYKKIFGAFDQKLSSDRYVDLTCAVWAGLLVKSLIAKLASKDDKYNARIARLLLVKMFFNGVRGNRELEGPIRDVLSDHYFVRKYVPVAMLTFTKSRLKQLVSIQTRYQAKEPRVDFSNFFKRNDLAERAYLDVFPSTEKKRLAKMVEKYAASLPR